MSTKWYCRECRKTDGRNWLPKGRALIPCTECCGWKVIHEPVPLTVRGAVKVAAGNMHVNLPRTAG